jgi:hypothetical protein
MSSSLRIFVSEFVGAVFAMLVLVAIITFVTIPYSLGGHPGEPRPGAIPTSQHFS